MKFYVLAVIGALLLLASYEEARAEWVTVCNQYGCRRIYRSANPYEVRPRDRRPRCFDCYRFPRER